ncbi:TPA: hypothetical protein DIV49_03170 [Candidatus Saccharibacteria bacterium]|nr:hypothetical protein [Candidatus Saccharibacteria bacterium]HRJ90865.1 DUF1761 domain-containing protein [Candidatus Saccharibacteria bacterium]
MELLQTIFSDVNWWVVLVAVLSTLPVGYLWYDLKMGFGKKWAKLVGVTEKQMNDTSDMGKTFGVMLFVSLLTALLLNVLLKEYAVTDFVDGLVFGAVVGLVLRGGSHFIHNGFAKRSLELSWIDAGHDMVSVAVMAAILAVWG